MNDKACQTSVSALLVGEFAADRLLVHDIFRKFGWRLFEAADRRCALQVLEREPVQVVVAESCLPRWNWRKVLSDLRRLALPSQLVVASRTADEHLWAEALNIGAYDVLAQPFDREEVERVIASASRHSQVQCKGQALALAAPAAGAA